MVVKLVIHLHLLKYNNMINIKLLIQMLGSSDINSEDLAIAKGKYEMPSNLNDLKQLIKIRRNG